MTCEEEKYTEGDIAFLRRTLDNEIMVYYTDAPHLHSFNKLDVTDKNLVLKLLMRLVSLRDNTFSYKCSIEQIQAAIKSIIMIKTVPLNYIGETKGRTFDVPKPNRTFDNRHIKDDDFPPYSKYTDKFRRNPHFSPFSFAVAEHLYPIVNEMLDRKDLDVNGNHDSSCPHAIDFMNNECVANGIAQKLIQRDDFNAQAFVDEVYYLIHDALDTRDITTVVNALKLSKSIINNDRFPKDLQEQSMVFSEVGKQRLLKLI